MLKFTYGNHKEQNKRDIKEMIRQASKREKAHRKKTTKKEKNTVKTRNPKQEKEGTTIKYQETN